MRITTLIGYVLLIGLTLAAIIAGSGLDSIMDFVDAPSILIVFGGALGLYLMGKSAKSEKELAKLHMAQMLTCAFFISAILGDLLGAILMLGNLKDPSVLGPSMAVCLLTSLYGLFAVVLISYPLEDRRSKYLGKSISLSQIVWFFFPLYSVMFLMITFFILLFALSSTVTS